MDRTLIIILCVAFIVVWMLGKRFFGKKKEPQSGANELMRQVETWYSVVQEQVALMDESLRAEREAEWNALPEAERIQMANDFFTRHFGEQSVAVYSTEEKLRVSSAWFISSSGKTS